MGLWGCQWGLKHRKQELRNTSDGALMMICIETGSIDASAVRLVEISGTFRPSICWLSRTWTRSLTFGLRGPECQHRWAGDEEDDKLLRRLLSRSQASTNWGPRCPRRCILVGLGKYWTLEDNGWKCGPGWKLGRMEDMNLRTSSSIDMKAGDNKSMLQLDARERMRNSFNTDHLMRGMKHSALHSSGRPMLLPACTPSWSYLLVTFTSVSSPLLLLSWLW